MISVMTVENVNSIMASTNMLSQQTVCRNITIKTWFTSLMGQTGREGDD